MGILSSSGFMHSRVSDHGDGTVLKIPRKPGNTTAADEMSSFLVHRTYLGENIVPELDIGAQFKDKFEISQELVHKGTPIDLAIEFTKNDVQKLLENGARMQKDKKILFDIFGLQGMIRLFNHYFSSTLLGNISHYTLPLNAKYLQAMHNFPPELLAKLNADTTSSPFIAHNILRDENGALKFVDTDYRPLDPLHPLNVTGNWITQKALHDLYKTTQTIIRV